MNRAPTDLDKIKLCYQALGNAADMPMSEQYNPLTNDAQAMYRLNGADREGWEGDRGRRTR